MKFVLEKRIDLKQFGKGWEDCYITIKSPTYAQIKEILKGDEKESVDRGIKLMENQFVSGKAFDGKAVVDFAPADIKELPIQIINHCFTELAGDISPKSKEN